MSEAAPNPDDSAGHYQVLARKYRPLRLDDLIGQESLVRTLQNAFESDRIAHAFILTGIRGIGKTTTARILARSLNCTDAGDRPTTNPCGRCSACVDISASRHLDVVEIDAASHTGVDHARELISEARHTPASGRFRVFIIDEVHMLSRSAFNALLKTLEEPPPHAKFILATTEIRKVPVTVLSRCQRFDLRRVDSDRLMQHVQAIAEAEGVTAEQGAVALIARAAEGSVRDALSLLDQAIAHRHAGDGIRLADIRDMLALADRARVLDLFEQILRGDAAAALAELAGQHRDGAEPLNILESLAETCHFVSVLRVSPALADDPAITEAERQRGMEFAARLEAPTLVRFWQILERALDETRRSATPRLAADMAVLRLAHASTLPTPDELITRLQESGPDGDPGSAAPGRGPAPAAATGAAPGADSAPAAARASGAAAPVTLASASDLAALVRAQGDPALLFHVQNVFRPVSFAARHLRFQPAEGAPRFLARDLRACLERATGETWTVEPVEAGGGPTLAETRRRESRELEARVLEHAEFRTLQKLVGGAELTACYPDAEAGHAAN